MARGRTAIGTSTPLGPVSFLTICLACSIAGLGRQLLLNPRLRGLPRRVCGLMSAPAYEACGAKAEDRRRFTPRLAPGALETKTEDARETSRPSRTRCAT